MIYPAVPAGSPGASSPGNAARPGEIGGTRLSIPSDDELKKRFGHGPLKVHGHLRTRSGIYRQVDIGRCSLSLQPNYKGAPLEPGEQHPPGYQVDIIFWELNRQMVESRELVTTQTLHEALQVYQRFENWARLHCLTTKIYHTESHWEAADRARRRR